ALRLVADGNHSLARIPTDRGLLLSSKPLASRARRAWQEATVWTEYFYDYGMPDWLARFDKALAPLSLEKLILGRHKFYHFRVWYRDQLAGCVRDILLDSRSLNRSYLNGSKVRSMVEEHVGGKRNHTAVIHKLLTAELAHRQLIAP